MRSIPHPAAEQFMCWPIYVLAAAAAAGISLVATWAARSRMHWVWRRAALLTCFLLLVPIGAAELNLLLVPVALILFLATAGRDWWQLRRQRIASNADQNAASGARKPIRF